MPVGCPARLVQDMGLRTRPRPQGRGDRRRGSQNRLSRWAFPSRETWPPPAPRPSTGHLVTLPADVGPLQPRNRVETSLLLTSEGERDWWPRAPSLACPAQNGGDAEQGAPGGAAGGVPAATRAAMGKPGAARSFGVSSLSVRLAKAPFTGGTGARRGASDLMLCDPRTSWLSHLPRCQWKQLVISANIPRLPRCGA